MSISGDGKHMAALMRASIERQIDDYKAQMRGTTGEHRAMMRRELISLYGLVRRFRRVEEGRELKSRQSFPTQPLLADRPAGATLH